MGAEVIMNLERDENGVGRIYEEYKKLLGRFYSREEGESLIFNILRQGGKSSFIHRKSELVDKLRKAGIDASINMSIEDLKGCVRKLPDGIQMDKQMFDVLFDFYRVFMPPAKYMEKIVRRLGAEKYRECSVRLAILKQFILNTDYHTGSIKEMIRTRIHTETGTIVPRKNSNREMLADWADEGLFNILNSRLSKAEKKKYALLRLCDDLAAGRFRTNGSTRLSLYMFSFAFDMVFYPDSSVEDYDPNLDMERNLFFDYYGNHMLRFLSIETQENQSDYESVPSGEGINYKNYAEVIYLYYLNRKDIPIRERIKRAQAMIENCRMIADERPAKSKKKADRKSAETNDYYTYVYKDYSSDIFHNLTEEEIPEYIVSHYIFPKWKTNESGTRLMPASETMTALYHYKSFFKNKNKIKYNDRFEVENILAEEMGWNPEYVALLSKLNEMLHPQIDINNMHLTRVDMIAAFYNYCRQSSEQEGMSLEELYEDCCLKLNPILADSRFQPLMITNIFDIFMIIMLYRYLNIV